MTLLEAGEEVAGDSLSSHLLSYNRAFPRHRIRVVSRMAFPLEFMSFLTPLCRSRLLAPLHRKWCRPILISPDAVVLVAKL